MRQKGPKCKTSNDCGHWSSSHPKQRFEMSRSDRKLTKTCTQKTKEWGSDRWERSGEWKEGSKSPYIHQGMIRSQNNTNIYIFNKSRITSHHTRVKPVMEPGVN